ncbi:hypothetical protein PQO03_05425 [Lentisphaera profundi]|uniref:Leucine-rich repeat domain-containing protein n=1 Tax=Lentisphaera profundi TaxID=1658616 RepID=A0ABY7VX64_9BACT|nr:hypothetical protein [Lentisphaera profundi]WDE97391.1 hypothetical protein PQO03_05425 [Lentisphaera profundi]
MFKQFFICSALLISTLSAKDSSIAADRASIKEYSSDTRKKLKALEPKDEFILNIGQNIDQDTFAKICSDSPWTTELRTDYGNKNLDSFAPLAKLSELRIFKVMKWEKSEETAIDLSPLSELIEMEEANFYATRVTNTQALNKLTKLKKLSFYMSAIDDLSFLANTKDLEELSLYGYKHTFKDYASLASLSKLKKLDTYMNPQATDKNMQVFSNLTALENFSSSNNKSITHVDFLNNTKNLRK